MKGMIAHQHPIHVPEMEPARVGYHKIVADILRRAPSEDAARIAWQLVAGTKVAERTSVLDYREGILTVQAADLAWRDELLRFVPQYLDGLNKLLNPGVKRILFLAPDKKTPHHA